MALVREAVAVVLMAAALGAHAAPTGVDGVIGAEWGAPTASVAYDPGAPLGNFGTPGTTNHNVAYDIYLRSDGAYVYGAVKALGSTGGLDFANIYFNVDALPGPGSDLGVEVTNDRFFIPGGAGYTADTLGLLTYAIGAGVIEFAVDWSVFLDDVYGMGFNTAIPGSKLLMSLSQSFGYSVAGGPPYGPDRLGAVTVPDEVPAPATWLLVLLALSLGGLGARRRA